MLHHHIFNFIRIDVKAGNQNHIFFAIDDAQEPFVINHRDIPRVKPAVFDDFIRRVRALPVSQHHLRPLHAQLARLACWHLVALVIHQFYIGRGNGQPDTAAVIIDIMRVHADQRRALGQTVAFKQILSGQFHPTFCNRVLYRHTAASRKVQRREVQLLEFFVVQQGVKQGVNAGHRSKRIFRQLFHHARNVARVSDEQVLPAQFNKQQTVHSQRENVIQRQRRHHQLFPLMQQRPVGAFYLLQVCQHVAVRQHRAFRYAGCTARVLQERQIFGDQLRLHVLHPITCV